jgi:hypothetical protein
MRALLALKLLRFSDGELHSTIASNGRSQLLPSPSSHSPLDHEEAKEQHDRFGQMTREKVNVGHGHSSH